MRRLGILKEFDKTSQSYEIRKYCKNIGMQKLTFEECSISLQSTDLVHFLLHESKLNCMPNLKNVGLRAKDVSKEFLCT